MQRAAASTAPSPPQDQRTSAYRNLGNETHPSKRRKVDPDIPEANIASNAVSIRERNDTDEEEKKREVAIEFLAEEAGETKWVLSAFSGNSGNATDSSLASLRVISTAYSEIDSEAPTAVAGRKIYGKFNKDEEVRNSRFPWRLLNREKRADGIPACSGSNIVEHI